MEKDRSAVRTIAKIIAKTVALKRNVLPLNPGTRIGLFGGTFDPVHKGHMAFADEAVAFLHLDSLLFIPAVLNPLKSGRHATPFHHRVAMLDLAVQGRPDFFVSTLEGNRQPPSFSIDTVKEIRHMVGHSAELFFLMGSDAFADIDKWKDGREIAAYSHLAVVPRPPAAMVDIPGLVERVFPEFSAESGASVWTHPAYQCRIISFDISPVPLSSTRLRSISRESADLGELVGDEVAVYIIENDLYPVAKP